MALLAEVSMWPMDKGASVGEYVAKVLDVIDRSGVKYRLGPLGTCLEGDYDEVMGLIRKCMRILQKQSDRVACTIKMDWRKGRRGGLESKIESVERRVGRKLRK